MKTFRERAARPHRYRVTIEHLYTPNADDELDPPLTFETSNQEALMLLFIVNRLRLADELDDDPILFESRTAQRGSTRPM